MSGPAAHEQKFESKVLLSASTLLEWDKWTAGSREYIQGAAPEGELDLLRALDEHRPIIKSLYDWVLPQFAGLHSADLESANRLITDYNDVLTGGRGAQMAAARDGRMRGGRPMAYPTTEVADGKVVEEAVRVEREATEKNHSEIDP
jgi:hypothetical protein